MQCNNLITLKGFKSVTGKPVYEAIIASGAHEYLFKTSITFFEASHTPPPVQFCSAAGNGAQRPSACAEAPAASSCRPEKAAACGSEE